MKYLLYYNLNTEFVNEQTSCNGDGTDVVSVVDGVAWTNNDEKAYYRHADNDSQNLTSYTVTVHHISIDRDTMASDDVYTVTNYRGKKSKLFIQAKTFSGYVVDGESALTLNVSANTEYTFTYANPMRIKPLTFNVLSGGIIAWRINDISQNPQASAHSKTIRYSKDNGITWNEINSKDSNAIQVVEGDTVQFVGNNSQYGSMSNEFFSHFVSYNGCLVDIEGNICSLVYSADFATHFMVSTASFKGLFIGTEVLNAKNLFLTNEVGPYSFQGMFSGCTSLTTAPELPATTLKDWCYGYMFSNCTSLTGGVTTIGNSATTMADYCCGYMFDGCTSLTTAPELPATTLAKYCYEHMFGGCTSLTTAPSILPATTLADYCCIYMFDGCTSLTTAPELPATTLAKDCYANMFQRCTSLTTAPELPATTLAEYCYAAMFARCCFTNSPELPATTLVKGCYQNMFSNCANLNYVKCLATDISATYCTYMWMNGVQTTSGRFVKASSMTNWATGISGIPTNWTVEDATL